MWRWRRVGTRALPCVNAYGRQSGLSWNDHLNVTDGMAGDFIVVEDEVPAVLGQVEVVVRLDFVLQGILADLRDNGIVQSPLQRGPIRKCWDIGQRQDLARLFEVQILIVFQILRLARGCLRSESSRGQSPQKVRRPQSRQKSPRQTESNCSTSGSTSAGSSVRTPFSKLRLRTLFAPIPTPVRLAEPKYAFLPSAMIHWKLARATYYLLPPQ